MKCPYCGHTDSKVVDSREMSGGIRRRRECLGCSQRFTTHERVQTGSLFVIKKDGRREEFDRTKLLTGIRKACEKRPLPVGSVEGMVDEIEAELYKQARPEIPTSTIGEMVMDRLRKLDHIAYIRFASVYRAFADLRDLRQELESLDGHPVTTPQPAAQAAPTQPAALPDGQKQATLFSQQDLNELAKQRLAQKRKRTSRQLSAK